ncbi:MAG: TspO/MBR family protein [Oscillospiraceae bacterium]
MKLTKKQVFILVLNILFPLIVGFISGRLAPNSQQVYNSINLPYYAPNAQVFPIVWGIIYLLAGVASFMVILSSYGNNNGENFYTNFEDYKRDKDKKFALGLYIILILLSGAWTPIFFTLGMWKLAFALIVLITILALVTAIKFWKINKISGIMLAPFVLWSGFASALFYNIIKMN